MNDNNHEDKHEETFEPSVDKTIDESAMVNPTQMNRGTKNIPNPYTRPDQTQVEGAPQQPAYYIGSSKIVGILGTGGMAKVYKVWNEKLEIYRAVKILLPNSQKELLKRFETEAKITAKLHHPNIVEIYNVGDWKGLPYIEMEIVEGITLDNLIAKQGKLSAPVCCAITYLVANALDYAHSQEFLLYGKNYQGVVHRDLKPANIMVSHRGELKLMDFGIARPTEAGLHTMDGHIVGTLQYLSPEQLDGIEIDNRTDIYSLGAILYEILTGTKTFPQATITNLMKMKATNTYRKFNDFDFHIENSLVKITEKCLQIDRNNRYNSVQDLLKDLAKALRSFTSQTPAEILQSFIDDPDKFASKQAFKRRIPKPLILTGAGIILVVGLTIGMVNLINLFSDKETTSTNTKQDKLAQVKDAEVKPKTPEVSTPKIVEPPEVNDKSGQKTEDKPKVNTKTKTGPKPGTRIKTGPKPVKLIGPKTGTKIKSTDNDKPKIASAVKIAPKVLTPLEKLQKKYGLSNPIEIGKQACVDGKYNDARTALEASKSEHSEKYFYLTWAYVELKEFRKAKSVASTVKLNDAFFQLLKGRIEAEIGNERKALTHYEASLTKPSNIKSQIEIRRDALFYQALIHDKHYRQSPSQETRIHALIAWRNLKKVYHSNPDHPRFRLANKKLASTN